MSFIGPAYDWARGKSIYEIYASYENIYEGTFIRNILRINNIVENIKNIASMINNSDLLKKDVLVIGPGLGKSFKTKKLFEIIESFHGPKILDADAISIFENKKNQFSKFLLQHKNIILTPHTGEFKRVFNYSL